MRRLSGWSRVCRAFEALLAVIGFVALAAYGWFTIEMRRLEAENRAAVSHMLRDSVSPIHAPDSTSIAPMPSTDFVGELDIPRLHISAAVRAGDDEDLLAGAVGYLPETPPPWRRGNSALVAHRDRLFSGLAGVRVGDEIFLWTTHGDFRYVVSETFVVDPNAVWVLDDVEGVDLTLITCYPFAYVGHAPHRFVVRATKSDGSRP